MARHNPLRSPAAIKIASYLPGLMRIAKSGNEFDRDAIYQATQAIQHFDSGDITERSRAKIFAAGSVMKYAATRGKFSAPLSLYAESILAWSMDSEYERAELLALESLAAAKAQRKAA